MYVEIVREFCLPRDWIMFLCVLTCTLLLAYRIIPSFERSISSGYIPRRYCPDRLVHGSRTFLPVFRFPAHSVSL